MSIRVMNLVWSKAPVSGGELLMLLALADNADDRGTAFPGVEYLASKARMSGRNVQLCIRKLEGAGFVKVIQNGGPSGANKYKINTELLDGLPDDFLPSKEERRGENISGVKNFHPVKSATEGVKNDAQGGEAGFTLTVIEPSKEPLSAQARTREAISGDDWQGDTATADPKRDRRAFMRFVNNWPNFAGMSLQSAEREWLSLSSEDRTAAASKRDAWIALLRKQGKDHTPAPSTYLKQRLWKAVPDVAEQPAERAFAPPFGKAWMNHVFKALEKGPGPLGPMPVFIAKQIAEGSEIGKREARERQARHGWPELNFMFNQAMDGKGIHVSAEEMQSLGEMEALAVDAPLFDAWRVAFHERGWPWLDVPKAVRFVWFPAGGPMAHLSEVEQATPSTPHGSFPDTPPLRAGTTRDFASDGGSKTDLTTLTT